MEVFIKRTDWSNRHFGPRLHEIEKKERPSYLRRSSQLCANQCKSPPSPPSTYEMAGTWWMWANVRASRVILGTFRFDFDYEYEYEYEFFNVYPMRMPDCVRLSRQLVLSSKSRRCPDANYEIFNKSRPPTTSSLQVQRRVKRLVFKGADTLRNVPCNLSRNVLATLWHLVLFVY